MVNQHINLDSCDEKVEMNLEPLNPDDPDVVCLRFVAIRAKRVMLRLNLNMSEDIFEKLRTLCQNYTSKEAESG